MDDIKKLIGKRIRYLRNNKKLSQEALAFYAELDRTYITSIENGKRNVSIVNIEKIANALGFSVLDFFNSEEFKYIKYNNYDESAAETHVADNKNNYK